MKMKKPKDRNPHHLCTLDPNSECDTCKNNNILDCKLNRKQPIITTLVIYSFIIISSLGLFLVGKITGMWWMLVVFAVFVVLFFIVIEPRITCSHCPFYAENRVRFNCPGNMLTPKIWRYHPEPMNKYEKLGTLVGFIFFGAFPVFSELYGIWFLISEGNTIMDVAVVELIVILFATIFLIIILYAIFLLLFCLKCVNFSCQFNRVPKPIADRYIKANPVMKDAWEKSGYKF
jgi:hypothetical protein